MSLVIRLAIVTVIGVIVMAFAASAMASDFGDGDAQLPGGMPTSAFARAVAVAPTHAADAASPPQHVSWRPEIVGGVVGGASLVAALGLVATRRTRSN